MLPNKAEIQLEYEPKKHISLEAHYDLGEGNSYSNYAWNKDNMSKWKIPTIIAAIKKDKE